jgi:hypothetical protein
MRQLASLMLLIGYYCPTPRKENYQARVINDLLGGELPLVRQQP